MTLHTNTRPTYALEKIFWRHGMNAVAGVDEAGVGPLAGPVVASLVILKPDFQLEQMVELNDSKLLNEQKRIYLRKIILEHCEDWSVGLADVNEIDKLNIFWATQLAMRRALKKIKCKPSLLLVDGNRPIKDVGIQQITIVKGDKKCSSIAAASIIAKTTRDLLMKNEHLKLPQYNFAQHKGYPTKEHITLIKQHGPSNIHRRSFLKNII